MSDLKIMIVIGLAAMLSWAFLLAIPYTFTFMLVMDFSSAGILDEFIAWITTLLITVILFLTALKTAFPFIGWIGKKYQKIAEWILKREISLD